MRLHSATIQGNITEQSFPVVLFTIRCKVVVTCRVLESDRSIVNVNLKQLFVVEGYLTPQARHSTQITGNY